MNHLKALRLTMDRLRGSQNDPTTHEKPHKPRGVAPSQNTPRAGSPEWDQYVKDKFHQESI